MNMVTNQMVEAAQARAQQRAGYLTLTDEFVRELIEAALREQEQADPVAVFDERLGHPVLLPTAPQLAEEQLLYAHPPQQRKPLTTEEIENLWHIIPWKKSIKLKAMAFARIIERAHGIRGEE